jgi:hypothetical protein
MLNFHFGQLGLREQIILGAALSVVLFGVFYWLLSVFSGARRGRGVRVSWRRGWRRSRPEEPVVDRQLSAVLAVEVSRRKPINKSAYRLLIEIEKAIRENAPRARVLAEVGMGAFLSTGKPGEQSPDDKAAFWAFNAKRVDFLVIDGWGNPAFAVEYQGTGHYLDNTADGRDAVKKAALRSGGVELVEIHAHMSAEEQNALLAGAVRRNCVEAGKS